MEELKALAGATDQKSLDRRNELTEWLLTNKNGHEAMIDEFMESWLSEMEADVTDIKQEALRQTIDQDCYKLIPWSYIAKTYFGKSAAWLSQRINGTQVRGQIYTLNAEQKEILNRALSEIGQKIGSFRFA